MDTKITQVLLIISTLILSVLLFFFAPKTAAKPEGNLPGNKTVAFANSNIEVFVNMARKVLSPEQKSLSDNFVSKKMFDSAVVFWDRAKRPDIASYYVEQEARTAKSPDAWLNAGNRYYYAIQFSEDQSEIPLLYQCAMRCFSKTLELNPKNSDAKIMLASCYVEGTQAPMEGITLLREVEKTDSNNVKLQLAFAFFSVRSGQMDRAISRFNKVLKVDSSHIEAYLHLADAYEKQGLPLKSVEMLEKYAAKTPDVTAKLEVEKYIQQIRNNNNK